MTDQMIAHETSIMNEGFVYQAVCACGWKGRHFGSTVPAEREASSHVENAS